MSTETTPPKSTPVPAIAPSEKTQPVEASAATRADKPQAETIQAADKKAAAPTAAKPKADGLHLQLEELASTEPSRRASAATALGRLANVAAVPALITALDDSDADVAREAAASLGLLGSSTAVEPLIAVLNNSDGYFHSVVRAAATHSLSQLRDTRAVEPLINAIKDPIAEASAEAIRALASLSDPRGLPALLNVIRNEDGFFLNTTRRAAILGLAKIGGDQATAELTFVAGNQWEDAVVRAAAIEATREGSGSAGVSPAKA